MLEEFVDQGSCRTDLAIELDFADITFDRTQNEHRTSIDRLELAADDGQDVAISSIFGLKILDDRIETGPRHGGADDIGIKRSDHLRWVDRNALDTNGINPHRRAFRQRCRGRSGGYRR